MQWKSRAARLERKARPRSGSPRFIVRFTSLPSIFGTVVGISVRTISSIIVVVVRTVMVADTPTTVTIGVVTVTWCESSSIVPTR